MKIGANSAFQPISDAISRGEICLGLSCRYRFVYLSYTASGKVSRESLRNRKFRRFRAHFDELRSCFAATFERDVTIENGKTEEEQAQLEISKVSTKGTDHAKELCGPFRNFDTSLTDIDSIDSGSPQRHLERLTNDDEL